MPQKGDHHILADDKVWGNLKLIAHTKGLRVADYLEPFFFEIVRLVEEGQDALAILRKARKKKEVT